MSKERIQKLLRKTGVLLQDDDLSTLERDLAKKYLIEIYDLLDTGTQTETIKEQRQSIPPVEVASKVEAPVPPQPLRRKSMPEVSNQKNDLSIENKKTAPNPVRSFEPSISQPMDDKEKKEVSEVNIVRPSRPQPAEVSRESKPSVVPPDFKREIGDVVTRTNVIPDKHKVLFKRDSQNELSDKLSLSPIADLRRAHGINDKLLVVNELFNGEQESYLETIDVLNAKYSFADAQSYLVRYVIDKFGWLDEEKIEPARHFIKLVKRRFLET